MSAVGTRKTVPYFISLIFSFSPSLLSVQNKNINFKYLGRYFYFFLGSIMILFYVGTLRANFIDMAFLLLPQNLLKLVVAITRLV